MLKMTENVLKNLVAPTTESMLRKELSCPRCKRPISPPIYHCDKGHSFCTLCYRYGYDCTSCGSMCSGGRTHHLERIVELYTYQCKFLNKGCRKICNIKKLRAHEAGCQKFQMHCPFMFDTDCTNIGNRQQTVFHCQLVHYDRTFVGKGPLRFCMTNSFISSITAIQHKINRLKIKKKKKKKKKKKMKKNRKKRKKKKKIIFISFYMLYIDEIIFQVVCQYELEHIKIAMYRLSSPSEEDDRFEFALLLHNDDDIPKAVITNECATIGEKPHNPLFDDTFVNVDIEILKSCQYCTVQIIPKN